jgi:PAS domain-containing protein
VEHPIIAPDGETKWLSVNAAPLLDENAQPYGAVASFRDITERKWAEAEIRHLSSFPQMNPDPVLEIDASGAITFCNPATTAILERLGVENDARAFLPSDLDAMLRELEHKRETDFYREIQVGGLIFGETIGLVPAFNVVRIYARDITESKRAEDGRRKKVVPPSLGVAGQDIAPTPTATACM